MAHPRFLTSAAAALVALLGSSLLTVPASAQTLPERAIAQNIRSEVAVEQGAPMITGTPIFGEVLTANDGQWDASVSRSWLRDGAQIGGATGNTYTLTAADVGARISIMVTGTREGLRTTSISAETGVVQGREFDRVPILDVSGFYRVGNTVSIRWFESSWTPGASATTIQWLRNDAPIDGATGSFYVLTTADLDASIRVSVTGYRDGYVPTTVTSDPTPPVFIDLPFMDFTADSKADVLARDSSGNLHVYAGNGAGGWKPRSTIGSGYLGFTLIRPGDITGEGAPDYLARDSSGRLWMYAGSGRVQVGSGWQGFTSIFGSGDFNGDGHNDVMARNGAGALYLYPGNGTGGWKKAVKIGSGWQSFTAVLGSGDFNGDGHNDVMARDKAGALYLYPGNGTGGWKKAVKIGSGWQSFTAVLGSGDFNGDGANDVMARDKAGALYLYPGNGTGGWKKAVKIGSGWQNFTAIF